MIFCGCVIDDVVEFDEVIVFFIFEFFELKDFFLFNNVFFLDLKFKGKGNNKNLIICKFMVFVNLNR